LKSRCSTSLRITAGGDGCWHMAVRSMKMAKSASSMLRLRLTLSE